MGDEAYGMKSTNISREEAIYYCIRDINKCENEIKVNWFYLNHLEVTDEELFIAKQRVKKEIEVEQRKANDRRTT